MFLLCVIYLVSLSSVTFCVSLKSNIKNNISQEGINEIEDLFNILSKGKFSNK